MNDVSSWTTYTYPATFKAVPFSTSSNGQTGNNIYDETSQSHGAPHTVRDETADVNSEVELCESCSRL